jgi:membrane peptidoglycan carboxypeptidase
MYLNQVPYGGNSYGIQSAAKTYFGKDAKNLDLPEAALLAGLPQAPSVYSPFVNPQYAVDRRNEVLLQMKDQKYITDSQYQAAKKTPLKVTSPATTINAPHFVFKVKKELEDMFGPELVEEGGLKVTTTLDLDFQKQAEKILKDSIEKQKHLNVNNGAVLITRPPTGEIVTMVGSVDYFAQPYGAFNVTTALRQPGSSIKPLNYAVGIDQKIVTPATVFFDQDTCFPGGQGKKYCPVNYDGKYHGPVQLRFALANSYNVPAVRMLELN